MARSRGGDNPARVKSDRRGEKYRYRQVYVYVEGEVTEAEYLTLVLKHGEPRQADRSVQHHIMNPTATGKHRKPLPMVEDAVRTLRNVEREARKAGLNRKKDWNWPQVWVLFDRDDHEGITEAMKLAREHGIGIAYSHPCFELWRLLHYQNYTSTFGRSCKSANKRLREQPGFAQTYGKKSVSEQESKSVKADQVLRDKQKQAHQSPYASAKKFAKKINDGHTDGNPNNWDPYTDVWRFVEEGLLLSGY